MSGEHDFSSALWMAFLSYLYSQGKIEVPQDYRSRIAAVRYMLDSDFTGLINTIIDYAINSASQAEFTVECSDDNLRILFNEWLRNVNLNIDGIPTGIKELSKEYYKERWKESSFILARASKWQEIKINGIAIKVPTVIWLVNGASIYVVRDKNKYTLGSDKFYLDSSHDYSLPQKGEKIVIQKPYDRWWTQYSTPYLIRKGVYRNFRALEMLQEKTEEVLTKFLPYLFAITKGTERLFLEGKIEYSDEELKQMSDVLKEKLEQYKRQKGKTPVVVNPFDTKMEHLIPDLRNILSEELFSQGYRAILAGLGFVDVVQGLTSTRRESILNPAPFIEEVNAGVDGFKSLLMELILLIIKENKIDHSRLFNRNNKLYIASSPLKINVATILDQLRSSFVYGAISVKTYQELLGINPDTERERMKDEWENGDRDLFYPHLVQNREDLPDIYTKTEKPPITKKEIEKNLEQEKNPELKIKAALEETENYYRNRLEEPNLFQKDSFRTIWLSKEKGIKAIIGKKKNETSTSLQSILFDKNRWTKQDAEKWVKENYSTSSLSENIEKAPYHKLEELPISVKKLSKELQELWMKVWNETYDRYGEESRAYRTAWSVVNKQRVKK